MKLPEFNDQGERLVLAHEAVRPYRTLFWGCFLGALAYLVWIFLSAWG